MANWLYFVGLRRSINDSQFFKKTVNYGRGVSAAGKARQC
jgi:hypothetical protein